MQQRFATLLLTLACAVTALAATSHSARSGTSTVPISSASYPVRVDPVGTTTQPISGTVTGNQGTANTVANGWPFKVTDGTNTATVSTAGQFSVLQYPGTVSYTKASSLPVNGIVIKNTAGVALGAKALVNTTGGTIYLQLFCSNAVPPAGGAQPDDVSSNLVNSATAVQSAAWGQTPYGLPCASGVSVVASSTPSAYTAIASTNVSYTLVYY